MSASDYTEAAVLNSLFGKTSNFGALASRPTLYVALCTATPTDANTGSTITEANYTGYARVATAASDWNAASGTTPTSISNANAITFPTATGGTSVITAFALCDAMTGGNVIVSGLLAAPITVSNLIGVSFAPGALSVTCD